MKCWALSNDKGQYSKRRLRKKIINKNRFKIASKIVQYNPLQNVVAQIKNVESPMKRP